MPADWTERAARRAAPKDRAMATMVIDVVVRPEMVWGWNEGAMDGGVGKDGEKNARGVEGELGRAYVSRALSAGPNRSTSRSPQRQSISIVHYHLVCSSENCAAGSCSSRPCTRKTVAQLPTKGMGGQSDSCDPSPSASTCNCVTCRINTTTLHRQLLQNYTSAEISVHHIT